MTENPAALQRQRRLLESLGFGFMEEPVDLPAPEEPNRKAAPPPRKPAPQSRPAARAPEPRGSASAPRRPAAPALTPIAKLPELPLAERQQMLKKLSGHVIACTRCNLQHMRTNAVPGEGSETAELIVVTELPLEADDKSGRTAQGEFGELLDNMLKAMGYRREDVFLTPAVKCRPAGGRAPLEEETTACSPYLVRQVETIRPRAIVCLGITGGRILFPGEARKGIAAVRGRWLDYRGIPVMVTFSLPYIHRTKERKKVVWGDLQEVMKKLGKK